MCHGKMNAEKTLVYINLTRLSEAVFICRRCTLTCADTHTVYIVKIKIVLCRVVSHVCRRSWVRLQSRLAINWWTDGFISYYHHFKILILDFGQHTHDCYLIILKIQVDLQNAAHVSALFTACFKNNFKVRTCRTHRMFGRRKNTGTVS